MFIIKSLNSRVHDILFTISIIIFHLVRNGALSYVRETVMGMGEVMERNWEILIVNGGKDTTLIQTQNSPIQVICE